MAAIVFVSLALGGALWAFVLAQRTGELSLAGKLSFALVLACGVGLIPAMTMGSIAVQRRAFAAYAEGDPDVAARARRMQLHYKLAVAAAIIGTILAILTVR